MFEESGVKVSAEDLVFVGRKNTPLGVLDIFFVATDISGARTMETKIIQIADFDAALANARGDGADKYAPDFLELVDLVMPHLLRVRESATAPVQNCPESEAARPTATDYGRCHK